jgi:hypothetical protein
MRRGTIERLSMPVLWAGYGEALGLSVVETKRLWKALTHSHHAQVRALVYVIVQRADREDPLVALEKLILGPLKPRSFIPLLERLVEDGLLSRALATKVEETYLAYTNQYGEWR